MNKIATLFVLLNATVALGQTKSEIYRFSKDILAEIDQGTTMWKYIPGAAKLSLSGHYSDILETYNKVRIVENCGLN